jgi:GNAT superfamily N-acetyltransferase
VITQQGSGMVEPMREPSRHTPPRRTTARRHWRHDLIELAAVFLAVAAADLAANLVAHAPEGPMTLAGSAVVLMAATGFHAWWARRHGHSPPVGESAATDGCARTANPSRSEHRCRHDDEFADGGADGSLWRLRTTVRDAPGSLATLCGALARHQVDILTLQTHPLSDGRTVDEFLLRAPAALAPQEINQAVAGASGRDNWLERADTHDLVDVPTRMLNLATRTALDAAELPLALRQLFGRVTIQSLPASAGALPPAEGELEDCVIRLRDPSGGTIVVERPYLPFTPTEFARARALLDLDARLGPRVPLHRDVLTLPEGDEITVRRADQGDLAAARAMHDRCSPAALASRYHGPAGDVDRYLEHLLGHRHGRTLAVEPASGQRIALGHLLWDGEDSEVALLVEDEWQRRSIGARLLGQLVAHADETGCRAVYAVTQSTNTAMVATMRGLGLPLDYQVEHGTLVVTAQLAAGRPAGGGDHLSAAAATEN